MNLGVYSLGDVWYGVDVCRSEQLTKQALHDRLSVRGPRVTSCTHMTSTPAFSQLAGVSFFPSHTISGLDERCPGPEIGPHSCGQRWYKVSDTTPAGLREGYLHRSCRAAPKLSGIAPEYCPH